ncbi:hypothetical protein CERZMDRAFT_91416 [Cercospora zeae-maydis SCOH1-5]|uniref:Secreted protein n=1 Tax=Cercospora zeae-maydis SCOH1-5 TaxID=717836 RepID=A0A6A6F8H4_9PEZI|nr:hypothetical protein CERZMDRAFT_91416 [Cercospora zeae-maydis SCOH1-5]
MLLLLLLLLLLHHLHSRASIRPHSTDHRRPSPTNKAHTCNSLRPCSLRRRSINKTTHLLPHLHQSAAPLLTATMVTLPYSRR